MRCWKSCATAGSVAAYLLCAKLEDRPGYLAALLPELLTHRERTGRPHSVVVNEAHHMLPASWDPSATALPSGLHGFIFVTLLPEALSLRTLDCLDDATKPSTETAAPSPPGSKEGIEDAELAAELRGTEVGRTPPGSARQMVRVAVERRCAAPA